jgi:hypothetical protein
LAAAFLGALMHVLAEKIEHRMLSLRDPPHLMADWNLHNPINISESSRYKSFSEVEAMAEQLLKNNSGFIRSKRMRSWRLNQPQHDEIPSDWHSQLFRLLCLRDFERLSKLLKKIGLRYLLIAFDECSQLNAKPLPDERSWEPVFYMTLIALQRLIKAADEFKIPGVAIWFLLLDTNSRVYDLAPWGRNVPSKRLTEGFRVLPPWHYVGFNQMVPKKMIDIVDKIKLPSDVLTIDHAKRYGRPVSISLLHSNVYFNYTCLF